jgi:3-phenylpropionate/trans-cinnamate dioxygenase ferredoxin component
MTTEGGSDPDKYRFYTLGSTDELPNGERLFVDIGKLQIVVFNIAGSYFAIGDVCTHDDGPLGDGELDGYVIICPRHGARFDIRTGKVLKLPAAVNTPSYPTRLVNGEIQVGVPIE